jgi:tetratricopeptide (TPR) repeat protein
MVEPDKKLIRYRDMLAEKGEMMVCVPEWLDMLYEPGMGGVSTFLNVFHKDHINVFSAQSIKNLFIKVGLKIEKEERDVYGQDFILSKCAPSNAIIKEDWQAQRDKILRIKRAIEHYRKEEFRDAITVWPKFPMAYLDWIFNTNVRKDDGKQKDLFDEAMALMPNEITLLNGLGQWHYQRQRYDQALELYKQIEVRKVNEDILMFKGYCLYHTGKHYEAMNAFHQSAEMNPLKWQEAMTWICKIASEMPSWEEKATEKVKEQLFEKARPQIEAVDPIFDGNGQGEKEKVVETESKK